MKIKPYLSHCLLAASLGSSLSYAEPNQPCAEDDKDCKQPIYTLDKVTVTATRSETSNSKYPGSIGVIDSEDMANSANVVDSLSTIPGLEAGGDNGRNIGSQYTVRGFGYQSESRVIIKQDGVPQSPSLFSNHISSFRTDTDILNRVEVVKGASSVLHGSGAIGGIVEMKTKDATDYLAEGEHFGGLLGLRYESNNMHSVRAGIYGKADSLPIDFLLYGKTADYGEIDLADGGTPDYETIGNDEEINTSYLNIGFDISDEQRLTFSVFDFDESLETVWQTLYHYEINEDSPVIGSLQQTDYVVNYDYASSSNTLIDLSAKVYRSKAYYSRGWDNVDPDNGKRDQLTYKNEETRQGFNLKNIARFNSGAIGHVLLTGVEFNKREEDALYLRNGVYSDFGSMPNNYDDWGFYLQDVIDFGQLELTLAGRYDRFDRSIDRPGAFDYEDSHFSPRVALAYEISPGLNLLLGYSETFRAPTPHETSSEGALNPHYYYMPNADLEAETAREFEGGFSYNSKGLWLADDEISIKASYFDGDIEDMISLQRLPELGTPPESRFYAQYQNIDNARRKGYEIELTYSLSKLVVSSSFEHLELYDEQTGENVNQAFADKLQMSATYVNNELGLQIGLGMDHWFEPDQNPATIVSRGKTYTYVDGDFTQFNLKGVWNIPLANMGIIEAAKLKFGVNNLTDKQYINARYTNNTSRVGNGSNIYIDLELDF